MRNFDFLFGDNNAEQEKQVSVVAEEKKQASSEGSFFSDFYTETKPAPQLGTNTGIITERADITEVQPAPALVETSIVELSPNISMSVEEYVEEDVEEPVIVEPAVYGSIDDILDSPEFLELGEMFSQDLHGAFPELNKQDFPQGIPDNFRPDWDELENHRINWELIKGDVEQNEPKLSQAEELIALLEEQLREAKKNYRDRKSEFADLRKEESKRESFYRNEHTAFWNSVNLSSQSDELEDLAKTFPWYTGVIAPSGETYKAMIHQIHAAKFIAVGKRVILGDGMGLGKTCTSAASMDLAGLNKVLIVTPAEITDNFLKEIRMWSDRMVIDLKGEDKAMRTMALDMYRQMDRATLVINYEAWRKDTSVIEDIINVGFDGIYMDEAHNMKNASSITFKGLQAIVHAPNVCVVCGNKKTVRIKERRAVVEVATEWDDFGVANAWEMRETGKVIAYNTLPQTCETCKWDGGFLGMDEEELYEKNRSVKVVVPLTGTPILNSPEDLFPLLNLIDNSSFPDINKFRDQYCVQDSYNGKWTFTSGGQDRLVNIDLKGRFIARTLEDVGIELPTQHKHRVSVHITDESHPGQREIMRQLAKHSEIILEESGDTMSIVAIIALITRQRQSVCYPGGIQLKDADGNVIFSVAEEVQESAKFDKAEELIAGFVERGERFVLFSQFTEALEELDRRLVAKGVRSVVYAGLTRQDKRLEIKSNFDRKNGEEPKWDGVLCQYKSGGVGLNLTAATNLIILDKEWNPGKEEQAEKRIHRIGQTEETHVYEIVAEGTIDQWMIDLNNEKADFIAGFTNDTRELQAEMFSALSAALLGTK